jgi:hypothetical protein
MFDVCACVCVCVCVCVFFVFFCDEFVVVRKYERFLTKIKLTYKIHIVS